MLVSTPHLARLVKGIVYSTRIFPDLFSGIHMDFERWCGYFHSFSPSHKEAPYLLLSRGRSMADLHRYYWNRCGQVHIQRLVQEFDIEEKDLEDAFSNEDIYNILWCS